MPIDKRILVIVPCFNEGASVEKVIGDIKALDHNLDTVVIDDGSSDDTAEKARRCSACLILLENLGIGGAVQLGIKYAHEYGYDLCIQLDGDGQHPASEIPRLLSEYEARPSNMIVGSRFLSKDGFQSTIFRRIGIGCICFFLRRLFHIRITDPTSGFRLMDRHAMDLFRKKYPTDFPEPISLAICKESGVDIREVPVRMQAREQGVSSITGLKPLLYMLRVTAALCFIRMGRYI